MKNIITFDVELTPNQKLAQEKLEEVHKLYDEIEKLLGTQDVFKRPHLFMELPQKEPKTNEEYLRSCTTKELAEELLEHFEWGVTVNAENCFTNEYIDGIRKHIMDWLKDIKK